jgi:hypothetical protein
MILFAVLASPLGRDQPTEVWLLSRIRFLLKPRKRIWDQSGQQHLVTITAPKKQKKQLAKDFSQTEVQSRLKALASTLDTRGWAVKNVDENLSISHLPSEEDSDRIIKEPEAPKESASVEIDASDDILDEKNNQTAKKFDTLIKQADKQRKNALLERVKSAVLKPPPKAEHKEEAKTSSPHHVHEESKGNPPASPEHKHPQKTQAHHQKSRAAHHEKSRTASKPVHKPEAPKPIEKHPAKAMTEVEQTANMELAQTDNVLPLSVASVQHLASRQPQVKRIGPNEVELDLR